MQLKEFALINPKLEAKEVFQAIQTAIAPEVIDQALERSDRFEKRQRKLPASLVVCLVIAMSLWSSDSMGTVLKNLVNGLNRQWTKLGQYWKTPNSSSITTARQKLGCQVMSRLFDSMVRPLATSETPQRTCPHVAFLGGLRVMAVDGTVLDVPDSKSKKKGATKVEVRIVEYSIETDGELKTYRLITSLMDLALFPALLLAQQYRDSMGN